MRVLVWACLGLLSQVVKAQNEPFRNPSLSAAERMADLIHRMTLEEKIDLLSGYNDFFLHPCERLGIPAFRLADGPLGVASWGLFGRATAFPSAFRWLRHGIVSWQSGWDMPMHASGERVAFI